MKIVNWMIDFLQPATWLNNVPCFSLFFYWPNEVAFESSCLISHSGKAQTKQKSTTNICKWETNISSPHVWEKRYIRHINLTSSSPVTLQSVCLLKQKIDQEEDKSDQHSVCAAENLIMLLLLHLLFLENWFIRNVTDIDVTKKQMNIVPAGNKAQLRNTAIW